MEVNELLESEDDHNDIIEIIDIWHFIMSMMQCAGMDYDKIIYLCEDELNRDFEEDWDALFTIDFYDYSHQTSMIRLNSAILDVINVLPWKHWSKKTELDVSEVEEKIIDALYKWIELANIYCLDSDQVFNVYIQKNQVNIDRQSSGSYGLGVKNEDDNRGITV